MEKIDYSYHTHTSRCGHADGLDEEYVIEAIKYGIKTLWFTDHVFIDGIIQEGIRGDYSLFDDYINSINSLKEKYKNQIDIHIGFECEYNNNLYPYYKNLLESKKIDHLILGQHCFLENNKMVFYFNNGFNKEILYKYCDDLIDGIKSGLFDFVCHPDLFVNQFSMDDEDSKIIANRILKACEEYNIPIEINFQGLRIKEKRGYDEKHQYPNEDFFKLASNYNIKVLFGFDAHSPNHFSISKVDYGFYLVKKYNLKLINTSF